MRTHHMKLRIWIGTLLMLALLTACSEARQSTGSPTVPPLPSPIVHIILATPTPPTTVVGARLGGRDDAFASTYTEDAGHYDATIAGQPVTINTMVSGGTDGAARVIEIDVWPEGNAFDTKTAAKIAVTFLPSDAVHLRDVQDQFKDGNYVHVYHSNLLAASFDASVFVDSVDLTTPIPSGTLSWTCSPHDLTNTLFNGCTISVRAPKS